MSYVGKDIPLQNEVTGQGRGKAKILRLHYIYTYIPNVTIIKI